MAIKLAKHIKKGKILASSEKAIADFFKTAVSNYSP
jgi:hypothetical protein